MTSVERARKFIQARGKAIALTIVPLASLAIAASQPAKAATVGLVFNAGGCSTSGSGIFSQPVGTCLDTPIAGFQNGANSLKLSGTSTVHAASGGFGSFTFEMTGTANSGNPAGSLPLSWDFGVGVSQQIGSGSYSLTYSFNSGSFSKTESGGLNFNTQCSDFTCANVVGTDQIGLDGPIHSYDVRLTVSGFFNQGTFLQIAVPVNSIDVNPIVTSGTPEPASLALGASGLLGLMFSRFRRRKV